MREAVIAAVLGVSRGTVESHAGTVHPGVGEYEVAEKGEATVPVPRRAVSRSGSRRDGHLGQPGEHRLGPLVT
jgi:hypothetical protein